MDPVVSKYIASGLNRESVSLAVANYGDNPSKVTGLAATGLYKPGNIWKNTLLFSL